MSTCVNNDAGSRDASDRPGDFSRVVYGSTTPGRNRTPLLNFGLFTARDGYAKFFSVTENR